MPNRNDDGELSRRTFLGLAGAGAAGAAAAAIAARSSFDRASRVIERAFGSDPAGLGSLADIDHFVLLMQENRSFDHYFGSMSGVRGFDDRSSAFRQVGLRTLDGQPPDVLLPFHLDTRSGAPLDADIVNDPAHDWAVQHEAWHEGRMDRWLSAHQRVEGAAAPMVMGYYTRADLPVHYALADAFTVCDHYFSSVLGPTAPNRLFWMTGTNDPEGTGGGPVCADVPDGARFRWRTFPENLEDAGVGWKIYNSPRSSNCQLTGMMQHFEQYQDRSSSLHRRGIDPTYPADFVRDVREEALPAVSWIIPAMSASEHPAHPAAVGADEIVRILATLTANQALWERTAVIVSYDENGGLFDHVAPPTPPPGMPEEFVRRHGRSQPVGLGFRVPCLVLSPYTRGGRIGSATFDHTSQLRLVGSRFDVPVPNLSLWRRLVTQDLTSLFRTVHTGEGWAPDFPDAAAAARAAVTGDGWLIDEAELGRRPPYPVPLNRMPRQEVLPRRLRLPR